MMERAVLVHNKHFFARNERVSADRAYPRQEFSILTYSAPHPTAIRLPHNCRALRPANLAAPHQLMTLLAITRLRASRRSAGHFGRESFCVSESRVLFVYLD
jgi:hypothetical protein